VLLTRRLFLPIKKIINRVRMFFSHITLKRNTREFVKTRPLSDKEKNNLLNWGSKKKGRFNTLVIRGMDPSKAYDIVEYQKGVVNVEKD